MNMAKLGTVSAAGNSFHSTGNPRQQRDCGMTRYTLCVFKEVAKRNGSQKFRLALLQLVCSIFQQVHDQRPELGWPDGFVQQMMSAYAGQLQNCRAGIPAD